MSLCPFGRRPRNLSSEILTDDRKRWFAQHLLDNLDTKASLAQKYNLKPHIHQIWKNCVRKGTPLWDSEALDSLSECVGSGEYQVRSSDFVKHAQKYCQETSQRRNRDVPEN